MIDVISFSIRLVIITNCTIMYAPTYMDPVCSWQKEKAREMREGRKKQRRREKGVMGIEGESIKYNIQGTCAPSGVRAGQEWDPPCPPGGSASMATAQMDADFRIKSMHFALTPFPSHGLVTQTRDR